MPKSTDPVVVLVRTPADSTRLAIVRPLATDGQICPRALAARDDSAQVTPWTASAIAVLATTRPSPSSAGQAPP